MKIIEYALTFIVVAAAVLLVRNELELRALKNSLPAQDIEESQATACALTETQPVADGGEREDEYPAPLALQEDEPKPLPITQTPPKEFLDELNDPKRKEYMHAWMTTGMDAMYAPLFRSFAMTPAQISYLKHLIVQKRLIERDGAKMMKQVNEVGKLHLQQQLQQEVAVVQQQVREFLGNEAYDIYEGYNATLPDRMVVKQVKDMLEAGQVNGLTYNQEDKLIRLIHEERLASDTLHNLADIQNLDELTELVALRDSSEEIVENYRLMTERISSRSWSILTADQQAVFTNHLEHSRTAVEFLFTVISSLSDDELAEQSK